MTRLASAIDPSRQPATARLAYETVRKAEAMGLVRETAPTDAIDLRQLQRVVAAIRAARIGEPTRIDLARASPRELARHLEKLSEALEESPVPEHEWRRLGAIVEPDQLARLLSISTSSVRRYLRGARATPDEVAARLHLLALVVGDLLGAYNEIGVRRWFERRRTQLGDRTPAELLAGNWKPEDPGPRQVRALARSLVGSPAT